MKGQVRVMAFVIVFIAVFTLFFIFDHLCKLSDECKAKVTEVCEKLKGLSIPTMVILLMVGVLSMIVCSVAYIILTFK